MINHLEGHTHFFLDKDKFVVNHLVFNEEDHDSPLLKDVMDHFGYADVVCGCTHGDAGIGQVWLGDRWSDIKPGITWTWNASTKQWEPPVPCPGDAKDWIWNDTTVSWDPYIAE